MGTPTARPGFGIDAPPVIGLFAGIAVLGVVLAFVPQVPFAFIPFLVIGLGTVALMLHSSWRGKVTMRDKVLRRVGVHEGDTVYSEVHVEAAISLGRGSGGLLRLRSLVHAVGEPDRPVLDWRFTALQF